MSLNKKGISRRQFIGATTASVAGLVIGTNAGFGAPAFIRNLGKPNSNFNGVQIGAITYSWRSMPSSAEQILQYCIESNISAVEFMGAPVEQFVGAPALPQGGGGGQNAAPQTPEQQAERAAKQKELAAWRAGASMDKFRQLRKMYNDAGVTIYAWKPSTFGVNNTDAEIDYGFRAAKELGATHITVELPTDSAQTKRLGDVASKYKIGAAYHQHLQATFNLWDEALAQSPYNQLNIDIGHYVAAGDLNPIAIIEKQHSRIGSMHIKDRKNKAHGGENVPYGQGDTPLAETLLLLKKNKYKFPASIEMQHAVPEGSNAVKEVASCVEWCRKVLESA